MTRRIVAGVLLLGTLIGFGVFSYASPDASAPRPATTELPWESEAEKRCEGFVTGSLTTPDIIGFPDAARVTKRGTDEYGVAASVYTEGASGGMIRTDYVCTLRYHGPDSWELVSLTLEE